MENITWLVGGKSWRYHGTCEGCYEASVARCIDCDGTYCAACMETHADECEPLEPSEAVQAREGE